MADVVLCYARRDEALARMLRAWLHGQGLDVWVDWEQVDSSQCWRRAVCGAIRSARALYFLATPCALASPNCLSEVVYALRTRTSVRVIPESFQAAVLPPSRAHRRAPRGHGAR